MIFKLFSRKLKALIPIGTPSERSMRKLRAIPIRAGEIAIDGGANVGLVTEVLAEWGGDVYAFEPNPHAYEVLVRRFRGREQVKCLQKGLYSEAGKLDLYLHEDANQDQVKWSTGSSLVSSKGNVDQNSSVEVELVDLAAFVLSLEQQVKVLKLDVEGVEYKILERMIQNGAIEKIDHVFVETHEKQIPEIVEEAQRVRKLIESKGYKHISLDWV